MNTQLIGIAALCAVLAVLLTAAVVRFGRRKNTPAGPPSATPLYDRVADELGIRPERPATFSAGTETDVAQALRVVR